MEPSLTPKINPLLIADAEREAHLLLARIQAQHARDPATPVPECPQCFRSGFGSGYLAALAKYRRDEVASENIRMRELIGEHDGLLAASNYEHAARTFEERCRQLEAALAQSQHEVLRLQVAESRLHHELRAARESAAAEKPVRITIAGGCTCDEETGGPSPASAEADTHPILLPLPARPRGSWLRRAWRLVAGNPRPVKSP